MGRNTNFPIFTQCSAETECLTYLSVLQMSQFSSPRQYDNVSRKICGEQIFFSEAFHAARGVCQIGQVILRQ